jgi:hypothetical protein
MGRISSFVSDTSVESSDKLLGSNINGTTKNFAVEDIAKFLANTNATGSAGQLVYSFEATASQKSNGSFLGTFSSGTAITNLTAIKVSKYPSGTTTDAAVEYLTLLVGKDILLSDVQNVNNHGVFTVSSVTQDSSATDYYDIVLVSKSGNGSIVDEQFYSIILYGASGDKTYVHTQGVASATWVVTHGLNKYPSVTIVDYANNTVTGAVEYNSLNQATITFTAIFDGTAYFN